MLIFALQAAALAEKQHGLRAAMRRSRSITVAAFGAAHAEIDHGDAVGGGVGHRPVAAADRDAVLLGEQLDVMAEVGQQDVSPNSSSGVPV